MFKLDLVKAEEPKIKLPISTGSFKKNKSSRKISISALLTRPRPLTVWITTNYGKFFTRWECQTTWPASREICMQVRKNRTGHGTTDWFQIGKGVRQGCISSPCLFNLYLEYIMRQAGINYKLESRLPGETSTTSDMQMTPLMAESEELNSGNSVRLHFWGLQNHCRWWLQPWN